LFLKFPVYLLRRRFVLGSAHICSPKIEAVKLSHSRVCNCLVDSQRVS
jgi:hypothetical protein